MQPGTAKYFLAILPPEPLQGKIMELKQYVYQNYGSKGALRSPAHITLHMPFEWKENKEHVLIDTLKDFRPGSTFDVQLNNYSCFEPRVIFIDVIKNNALEELQRELTWFVKSRLSLFNQYEDKRGFHAHVTIAFRDLKKTVFYDAWEEMKAKEFHGDFTASAFCLLKHNAQSWVKHHEFNFA